MRALCGLPRVTVQGATKLVAVGLALLLALIAALTQRA